MLTTKSTISEIIEAYSTLGKNGHKITIDKEPFIARCDRISPRANFGIKKVFAYRFKNELNMLNYVINFYNDKIKEEADEIQRKAKIKAQDAIDKELVKTGDIFCYSWGWDQTNVDFFQVISKKGKASLVVRPINFRTVEECSWGSDYVQAVANDFCGEEQTVRLKGANFKRNCGSARLMKDPTEKKYRSWYA